MGGPRKGFATGGRAIYYRVFRCLWFAPRISSWLISVCISAAMDGAEIRGLIIRVWRLVRKSITVSIGFLVSLLGRSRLRRGFLLPSCRSGVPVVGGVSQVWLRLGFACLMTRTRIWRCRYLRIRLRPIDISTMVRTYLFQLFVLRFSKFHFIMIDWIMKLLWFCPHGFCVISLSFSHA